MKKKLFLTTLFIATVFLFLACNKDEVNKPHLYLDRPAEGSTFQAGDTIYFRIRVDAGDNLITFIHSYVSDGDVQIFSDVSSYSINRYAITLQGKVILKTYIASGTYYLTFKVETGKYSYKYFFKINIIDMPLKIEYFANVYDNTVAIYDDSLETLLAQQSFGDSILDIQPANSEKAVYVLTREGILYKYDILNQNVNIIDQNLNNTINSFAGRMFLENLNGDYILYYPKSTSFVKLFHNIKSYSQTFPSLNQRSRVIFADGNYVYVATESAVGNERAMFYMFYASSLSLYRSFLLDYLTDPVSVERKNNNLFRIFGNKTDTIVYFDVYVQENAVYQYYLENLTSLHFAEQISSDKTLIGCQNGLYILEENGYYQVASGEYAECFNDSLFTGNFYLTDGTQNITVFSPLQESEITQKSIATQSYKLRAVYNK